jgi:CubicO group peptidase (beta-lactamase class C family)
LKTNEKPLSIMNKFAAVVLMSAIVASTHAQDLNKKVKEFDAYVENARKEWQVPGMAVAVVKDG